MILELLISQYKETEEIIKSMLDSISIQQGIDFSDINVIIANDGSDIKLSKEFLNSYPYNITYYTPEHLGMSEIRNFLLDHSSAEYIMFCDADDIFYTTNALWHIFQVIKQKEFDCYFPKYMKEEKYDNGLVNYRPEYGSEVHGKVLRRQHIIDNKIRWQKELLTHDSRYFLALCECCAPKDRVIYSNEPYYMWRYNRKSTTRSEADYLLQTFDYLTLSIVFLVEELLRRGFVVEAERTFVSFTYLVYFYYNCEEWGLERNKEMIDNAMRSFAIVYKKYRSFVDTSSQIKYQDIIRNNRNQMCKSQKTPYMEKITFEDWKKMILKLAENGGDINGNN